MTKCKIRPIKEWREGMLIHNGRICCIVNSVRDRTIDFYVNNGAWYGQYDIEIGIIYVNYAKEEFESGEFFEVIEMSAEDRKRWYVY